MIANRYPTFDITRATSSKWQILKARLFGEFVCGFDYDKNGAVTAVKGYRHKGHIYITDEIVMNVKPLIL